VAGFSPEEASEYRQWRSEVDQDRGRTCANMKRLFDFVQRFDASLKALDERVTELSRARERQTGGWRLAAWVVTAIVMALSAAVSMLTVWAKMSATSCGGPWGG